MATFDNDDAVNVGGVSVIQGFSTDDQFTISGSFLLPGASSGRIDGGPGFDSLSIEGGFFSTTEFVSIEETLLRQFDGSIFIDAASIADLGAISLGGGRVGLRLSESAGQNVSFDTLILDGQSLSVESEDMTASDAVTFDFSGATLINQRFTSFTVFGSVGEETVVAAPARGLFFLGDGADVLNVPANFADRLDFADFQDGLDKVDLSRLSLPVAQSVVATAQTADAPFDAVELTLPGGGTVLLRDLTLENFSADDVIFGTVLPGAPEPRNDAFTTDELTPVSGDIFADNGFGRDSDPEGDDFRVSRVVFDNGLEVEVSGGVSTGLLGGSFFLGETGGFDFNPGADFLDLAEGEERTVGLTYFLRDDTGIESLASGRIDFTVTGVDQIRAADDLFTVGAAKTVDGVPDAPLVGDLFADNGSGSDASSTGGLRIVSAQLADGSPLRIDAPDADRFDAAPGGFLALNSDGGFTFDQRDVNENLRPGESVSLSFTYTVDDDAAAGPVSADVQINVIGVNDEPVAADLSFTLRRGEIIDLDLLSLSVDPDGDALELGAGLGFGDGLPIGTFEIDRIDQGYRFGAYEDADLGTYEVFYSVTDGGESDGGRLEVTVIPFATEVVPDAATGDVIVNTFDDVSDRDPNTTSLREALLFADQSGRPVTIRLAAGDYALDGGVFGNLIQPSLVADAFDIRSGVDVTILGAGEGQTRLVLPTLFRDTIFDVKSGGTLSLQDLSFVGTGAPQPPHSVQPIFEQDSFVVDAASSTDLSDRRDEAIDSAFAAVRGLGGPESGAGVVVNRGSTTLSNVTFQQVDNAGAFFGRVTSEERGSVGKPFAAATVDPEVFARGAAIYNVAGTTTLDSVTVRDASANNGAAVYALDGAVNIADSAFINTTARGAIATEVVSRSETAKFKLDISTVNLTTTVDFGAELGAAIYSEGATIDIRDTVIDGHEIRYTDRLDPSAIDAAVIAATGSGRIIDSGGIEFRNLNIPDEADLIRGLAVPTGFSLVGSSAELAPQGAAPLALSAFAAPALAAVSAAVDAAPLVGDVTLDAGVDFDALLASGDLVLATIQDDAGALVFTTAGGYEIRVEGADLAVDASVFTTPVADLLADPTAIFALLTGGLVETVALMDPSGAMIGQATGVSLPIAEFAALAIQPDGALTTLDPRDVFGETLTVAGGGGADTVRSTERNETLAGGDGDDVYAYAAGDGADVIQDTGGVDRLTVSTLTPGDARYSDDGANLIIDFGDGDQITIVDAFGAGEIEFAVFDDGVVRTLDELRFNRDPDAFGERYDAVENTPLVVSAFDGVLFNDADPDDDPVTAALISGPANGTLDLDAFGAFTYTPDPDFTGTDGFTYAVRDGKGGASQAVAEITVGADPTTQAGPITLTYTGVIAGYQDDFGRSATNAAAPIGTAFSVSFTLSAIDQAIAAPEGEVDGDAAVTVFGEALGDTGVFTLDTDLNSDPFPLAPIGVNTAIGAATVTIGDQTFGLENGYAAVVDQTDETADPSVFATDTLAVSSLIELTELETGQAAFTRLPGDLFTFTLSDGSEAVFAPGSFFSLLGLGINGLDGAGFSVDNLSAFEGAEAFTFNADGLIDGDFGLGEIEALGLAEIAFAPVDGLLFDEDDDVSNAVNAAAVIQSVTVEGVDVDQGVDALATEPAVPFALSEVLLDANGDPVFADGIDDATFIADPAAAFPIVFDNDLDGEVDDFILIDLGDDFTFALEFQPDLTTLDIGEMSPPPGAGQPPVPYPDLSGPQEVPDVTVEIKADLPGVGETTIAVSAGNEAGSAGGVITNATMGESRFILAVEKSAFESSIGEATGGGPVNINTRGAGGEPGAGSGVGFELNGSFVELTDAELSSLEITVGPPPEPGDALAPELPGAQTGGGFEFESFFVENSETADFFDPIIAIGYAYVATGDNFFDAVIAPRVGDAVFDLFLFDDALGDFADSGIDLTADVRYDFAAPVERFQIRGVEVEAALDPTDPTAFVTGLSFERVGPASFTQTPLTLDVPDNLPPTPADDAFTTDEDTARFALDLLGNDDDPDDGDALSVTVIDDSATIGAATLNSDGTVDYDPNGRFEGLALGESATDSFAYTVSDGAGGSSEALVTITITGENDAPTAANDAVATDEDAAVEIAVSLLLDNDVDPDASDALSVVSIDETQTLGLASLAGGVVTYDPNGRFDALNAGETAIDRVDYTVSDGAGGLSTATVTVTIRGVDDPVLNVDPEALDDAFSTSEDDPRRALDVLSNDMDPDDDLLTVIGVDASETLGAVTLNADGTFDYDPVGRFEALRAGETATDRFGYTISDGREGTDDALVTVTITGVDDAPTAAADAFSTSFETALRLTPDQLTVNDDDPEGATLGVLVATGPSNGALNVALDGTLVYTPFDGFSGEDSFTYVADDGALSSAPATVTVTVGAPPRDGAFEISLVRADSDVVVGPIGADGMIDFDQLLGEAFSLQAEFLGEAPVGSISLQLDDGPARLETVAPFALFGDRAGDFGGRPAPEGPFQLTVRAFEETDGGGAVLATEVFDFTPVAAPMPSAFELYLVKADSDVVLGEIGAGGVFDASLLDGEAFSFEARYVGEGDIQSMSLQLDDGPRRVERVEPYALFGDGDGDFGGRAAPEAPFTITVAAFADPRGRGEALDEQTFEFSLGDTLL